MCPSKPLISSSPTRLLPWLLPSSLPPEPHLPATTSAAASSASILLAISNPNSNPKQVLSLFTSALRHRNFRHKLSTYASLLPFLLLHRRFRATQLLLRLLPFSGPSLLLPLASSALTASIPSDPAASLLLSASPSPSAFSSLLSFLIRSDHLSLARSLLIRSENLGFPLTIRHFAGLVRKHCLRREVEEAEEMVELMVRRGVLPDARIWNSLLLAVCDCRGVDYGFRVFLKMADLPDVITFSTLMGRMGMKGKVMSCDALFGRMLVVGVLPDFAFYRILVGVYCRNSMLGDVVRVFRAMEIDGFMDGGGIWEKSVLQCGVVFEEVVLSFVLKRGVVGDFGAVWQASGFSKS